MGELRKWLRNGLDLGGGKDSLGFLFLCVSLPLFLTYPAARAGRVHPPRVGAHTPRAPRPLAPPPL